jgi:hypothetical protein
VRVGLVATVSGALGGPCIQCSFGAPPGGTPLLWQQWRRGKFGLTSRVVEVLVLLLGDFLKGGALVSWVCRQREFGCWVTVEFRVWGSGFGCWVTVEFRV